MANISAQMVKELRESTGAGMMDCKAALTETNGDMQWSLILQLIAISRVPFPAPGSRLRPAKKR